MNIQQKLTSKITRKQLNQFVSKHSNGLYTLDLGCANSPYSKYFINRLGFDIEKGTGVDVVGDAHELPFENETFDQILCTEVLEHLHTPEQAIKEMHRVLKTGGTLLLTTRFIFPLHDTPNDYYRYTKYGLRHLFRNWEVIDIVPEVTTIETVGVLFQRIGFQTKLRVNIVSKVACFILARLFTWLNWMIVEEYGDIRKTEKEKNIMTSGYYLVVKK